MGLGKKAEGIKNNNKKKTHTKPYDDFQRERERGEEEVEKGEVGMNGDRRRLHLGSEHTIQYTHDVL